MASNIKRVPAQAADMTLLERLTQGRHGPLEWLGLGAIYSRPVKRRRTKARSRA